MPKKSKSSCVCGGGCATQLRQLWMMLYKNFLVMFRQWYWTLIILLWPGITSVIIWAAFYAGTGDNNGQATFSSAFPRCPVPGCRSMLYAPLTPESHQIMSSFASLNQLSISSNPTETYANISKLSGQQYRHGLGLSNSSLQGEYDVIGFLTTVDMETYLSNLSTFSKFWAAVIVQNTTSLFPFARGEGYTVLTGTLESPLFPLSVGTADAQNVQLAMDRAIIHARTGVDIRQEVTALPQPDVVDPLQSGNSIPSNASRDLLVISFGLAALFILGIWVHVGSVISQLNRDRETEVRLGLRMMGLQTFPYFFGNFIQHAFMALLTTLIITGGGWIARIAFFINSPFLLVWIILWLSACAAISLATWLGTWIHKAPVNNGMMIFLFLAFAGVAVAGSLNFVYPLIWYSKGGTAAGAFFFPLSLSGLVQHIGARAVPGGAFDVERNGTAPGYSWADLYDLRFSPTVLREDATRELGTLPVHMIAFLVGDIVLGLWFAWYFDTVWPGDKGVPESFFFFFKPSFWGLVAAAPMVATNAFDSNKINNVMADMDPDVNREHEEVLSLINSGSSDAIIKVVKLCKTFQTGRVGNRKDHRALDFVSFSCKKGTVLGILGHNGSGKTTTINLLTGVHAPSFGDAFIGPYSIQQNIQAIRRVIGVCPQKDILWDHMTAREHIKLFCLLKGVPWSKHNAVIMEALKSVRLESKVDKQVGTYSGGMKRRLSVAIASIGDPLAIFLDEPTAGLDPANRRELWKVIERLKKDRAVILTTHSMEEADMIADKITIYAVGRLRAVGDSLHLKQRFGAGYHLSLTTDENRSDELKTYVTGMLPEAHLDAENAGQLAYSLPRVRVQQLTKFFKWLESVSAKREPNGEIAAASSSALVKDFGLSQTTLEEVFIRLTHGDAILRQIMLGNAVTQSTGRDNDDHALRQMQLNVALDDGDEAIGFISVDVETDLAGVRRLITAELSRAPKRFAFLSQGIEIDSNQENRMYASDFIPMIVIKSLDEKGKGKIIEVDESSSSSKAKLSTKKSRRVSLEVEELKKELKLLQESFDMAQRQWQERERQLLARIAELEASSVFTPMLTTPSLMASQPASAQALPTGLSLPGDFSWNLQFTKAPQGEQLESSSGDAPPPPPEDSESDSASLLLHSSSSDSEN